MLEYVCMLNVALYPSKDSLPESLDHLKLPCSSNWVNSCKVGVGLLNTPADREASETTSCRGRIAEYVHWQREKCLI